MGAFTRAERSRARLRLGMIGPSGSGKTYSSLLLALGILETGGNRIAMIDTERESGSMYDHLGEYYVATLPPPFTPQRYIDLIKEAEKEHDIIIIDSLSHAWAGEGGLLSMHDKAADSTSNTFTAWRKVTPEHDKLVNTILNSPSHIIVTIRSKTAYEIVDDGGKKVPKKIGLAPVFRDGIEYEFTVVFDMAITGHTANASKDRTSLFDGQYFTITRDTGKNIHRWLLGGKPPTTNNIAFLEKVNELKAKIGGQIYFDILQGYMVENANEIIRREEQVAFYRELEAEAEKIDELKKTETALNEDPDPPDEQKENRFYREKEQDPPGKQEQQTLINQDPDDLPAWEKEQQEPEPGPEESAGEYYTDFENIFLKLKGEAFETFVLNSADKINGAPARTRKKAFEKWGEECPEKEWPLKPLKFDGHKKLNPSENEAGEPRINETAGVGHTGTENVNETRIFDFSELMMSEEWAEMLQRKKEHPKLFEKVAGGRNIVPKSIEDIRAIVDGIDVELSIMQ